MLPLLAASLVLLSSVHAALGFMRVSSTSQVKSAWYTDWRVDYYPLANVSWSKYNTVYYGFAGTTSNVSSLSLASNGSVLAEFVSTAHANNVEAHLSIGGWGGSIYFSPYVATAENRTAFVNTVVELVQQYDLDGLNFDWEYPGQQGIECEIVNRTADTANYLSFLQELRMNPTGACITISAAVADTPFINSTGQTSTDLSGFAAVLDYIAIMNYDVWGSWSSAVGPNAPLNDTCAAAADQQGSAVSAVMKWTNAGIPVDQIVLAVPDYGHSFSVNSSSAFVPGTKTLVAYPAFNSSNQPLGDAWDNTTTVDACNVTMGPGGTFRFLGLIDEGFLTTNGTPAEGIYYRFDSCSQTPYVYNETSQVMISYDNADSFAAKGSYIKNTGLLGYAMYETFGDYNDILIDAIASAA